MFSVPRNPARSDRGFLRLLWRPSSQGFLVWVFSRHRAIDAGWQAVRRRSGPGPEQARCFDAGQGRPTLRRSPAPRRDKYRRAAGGEHDRQVDDKGAYTHWKSAALSRRTPKADIRRDCTLETLLRQAGLAHAGEERAPKLGHHERLARSLHRANVEVRLQLQDTFGNGLCVLGAAR